MSSYCISSHRLLWDIDHSTSSNSNWDTLFTLETSRTISWQFCGEEATEQDMHVLYHHPSSGLHPANNKKRQFWQKCRSNSRKQANHIIPCVTAQLQKAFDTFAAFYPESVSCFYLRCAVSFQTASSVERRSVLPRPRRGLVERLECSPAPPLWRGPRGSGPTK